MIGGLVNNLTNRETTVYGGDVLVKSNSNIMSVADLQGLTAIGAAPYSTGLFQVQARALKDFGLNIYENLAVLGFNSNQSIIMQQLLDGAFDAGFLRADMVNTVLEDIGEPYNSVRILNSYTPDPKLYPYKTTGDYLVPEWGIGALAHVDQLVRVATAQALFAIKPNDPGPIRQSYVRWTSPFNYFELEQLQRSLGILDTNGTCAIAEDDDFYAYVQCPPDTIKLSREDVARRCAQHPSCRAEGTSCICYPCFRPIRTLLFGLRSPVFWLTLVGIWIVVSIIGWVLQFWMDNRIILEVPRGHLQFPDTPEIIGESRYGNIIKATLVTLEPPYKKIVAVHRLIRPSHDRSNGLFGPSLDIIDHEDGMTMSEVWHKLSEACRLAHPHLLKAEGVVKNDNEVWFVSEYPEAGNLYDLLHNQTLKVDMGNALRLLKEVAFALQYLHAEKPPVTQRVTVYNVWLDSNRISKLMLSDNYLPQSKSVTSDINYFGQFMADVVREVPKDTSRLADLDTSHDESESLINHCTASQARKRPKIGQIIERLTQIQIRWQANQDKALLSREAAYKQETDLLHSIFPKHVAEALREGKDVQPESFDCVSILFTDIVGFTTIAGKLSPIKVENMLDRLYKQFDALSVEYNVFKLETAGDAWLGVCNLHERQEDDHAAKIARFALRIVEVAKETPEDLDDLSNTLKIRVGINSGPVVASVAGSRNPRYCLFGNAINLAQRMESSSIAGCIHLSQLAAELVKEQAEDLRPRVRLREDVQDIKGKGKMHTYWLLTD